MNTGNLVRRVYRGLAVLFQWIFDGIATVLLAPVNLIIRALSSPLDPNERNA